MEQQVNDSKSERLVSPYLRRPFVGNCLLADADGYVARCHEA
jgi:hypothetical protein